MHIGEDVVLLLFFFVGNSMLSTRQCLGSKYLDKQA